jgi:rare lipoprotein A (peptidoglycan hydrolase)
MVRLSATSAALTAAALAAAVALPAAASTGVTNGGTSASAPPPPSADEQLRRAAEYRPAMATWFGPGLFGNRMACGSTLTHRTLGVAHKRLPCGTKVALRYRGRTVVVPVIDRGPYARGIDYDLTYATARKLGMRETSQVSVAALPF